MLKKSDVINEMIAGVIQQGAPGYENGKCCYRTSTGNKCAVGQIIPDERYNPMLENGYTIGTTKVQNALRDDVRELIDSLPGRNSLTGLDERDEFINDMAIVQLAHDNAARDVEYAAKDNVQEQSFIERFTQYLQNRPNLQRRYPDALAI